MPELRGMWIRFDLRGAIYDRDGWRCQYCGNGPRNGHDLNLDHVVTRGETEKPDNRPCNLLTACKSCNSSRKDMPWDEWVAAVAVRRGLNFHEFKAALEAQLEAPVSDRKEFRESIAKIGWPSTIMAYALGTK